MHKCLNCLDVGYVRTLKLTGRSISLLYYFVPRYFRNSRLHKISRVSCTTSTTRSVQRSIIFSATRIHNATVLDAGGLAISINPTSSFHFLLYL